MTRVLVEMALPVFMIIFPVKKYFVRGPTRERLRNE
ncbi:MAG: hypothetical protein BMS9Abin12_2148 [Acidimicrobiia bacterium]|nr:MAG: hypothetical protein BMS9Abin12_2148 [Acidimicrobiia bacterium]